MLMSLVIQISNAAPAVDTGALRRELEACIEGEVRFDAVSRALYSTDASVYQIQPLGVVVPEDREDILRALEICRRLRCPITMRGGGTSQAGQAIGDGLQIDTSKYFNRVLEVNAEERWVRVEPGIVLDELNAQLQPHGLRFAPDISTASRATIGGMMANNSSGARSVLYGKTIDHVLEQDVVLSDGSIVAFPRDPARAMCPAGDTLEAACYRTVLRLARRARGRDRPPLSEGAAPRRRLQPGRIRRSREAGQPGEDHGRLGRHAGHRARGEAAPGAAAEGEGGAGDQVRRPAGSARGHAGDPAPQALGGRGDGQVHPRPHAPERRRSTAFATRSSRAIPRPRCASSSTPIARRICRRGSRRSKQICARAALGYAYRSETDLAGAGAHLEPARSGARPVDGDEGRRQVDRRSSRTRRSRPRSCATTSTASSQIIHSHGTTAGIYAHASVGCLHVRPVINLKTERGRPQVRGDRAATSRTWCSNSAARSRASTATAWCAARSCGRCSGRCSTRRSARSSGPSIRTASSIPARSSMRRR